MLFGLQHMQVTAFCKAPYGYTGGGLSDRSIWSCGH